MLTQTNKTSQTTDVQLNSVPFFSYCLFVSYCMGEKTMASDYFPLSHYLSLSVQLDSERHWKFGYKVLSPIPIKSHNSAHVFFFEETHKQMTVEWHLALCWARWTFDQFYISFSFSFFFVQDMPQPQFRFFLPSVFISTPKLPFYFITSSFVCNFFFFTTIA